MSDDSKYACVSINHISGAVKMIPIPLAKALIAEKAVIVPKEPTEEMKTAGATVIWSDDFLDAEETAAELIYKAMIGGV